MPFIHQPRKGVVSRIGTVNTGAAAGGSGVRRTPVVGGYNPMPQRQEVATSRDRGAPERFEADAMGLVQTAAMAPAHALERPLAVANRLAGAITGSDEGPLGGILEGIGKIGIGDFNIGNALGTVGRTVMNIGDAPMALMNNAEANRIVAFANMSDDEVIDPRHGKFIDGAPILGIFGIGGRQMTVGEYKEELRRRGFFTETNYETGETRELSWEDLVAKAQADPFGFGQQMVNDSAFVDMAARLVGDPFNVLLGAGALGKLGRIAGWAQSRVAGSAVGRVVSGFGHGYMADMARTGIRLAQLPGERIAARAITAGRMEAATLRGLGLVLRTPRALILPGSGSLARQYARGAIRMDVGLLAAEGVSGAIDQGATTLLGEDNIISGFMEPIHDASQALLSDKPMSQDVTFMMVSAFAMPAIPLLREDIRAISDRAHESFGDPDLFMWSQRFGADDTGLGTLRDPMGRRRGAAKTDEFLTRIGGREGFARLIDHIDMRIAFERLASYSPIVKHFESFDEAMARSRAVGHVVAQEAKRLRETRQIKPRQRLEAFEEWGRSHTRTIVDRKGNIIRNLPERVDFELSNDALISQWLEYQRVHDELAARFQPVGEAIVGRANRLTKEDLDFIRGAIAGAAKDGAVSAAYVRDLLIQAPAMFEDHLLSPVQQEFWRRLMNLGVGNGQDGRGTFPLAELEQQLKALIDIAPTAKELYHEAARAEAKAPRINRRVTAGPIAPGRYRKLHSLKQLRDLRVENQGEVRRLTKEIDRGRAALESKWTSKGNLRVRRTRVTNDAVREHVTRLTTEIQKSLELSPEVSRTAAAMLEARARAWASHEPGRNPADYLARFAFEEGGDISADALFQAIEMPTLERVTDHAAFERAKAENSRPENLSPHSDEEFAASQAYMTADGKAGFMVSPEGDLQNVFNNSNVRGLGARGVQQAIELGAKTLDAYDGFLPGYYARFGFREVGRMKFVDEFAPDGWDFERLGRPDVVFMALEPTVPYRKSTRYFDDWDAAKAASREMADHAGDSRVQMVPVALLDRFMEIDRETTPKVRGDNAYLDELTDQIQKNGITDPLTLDYNPETGTAILGDGNHRLAVAKRLGLTEVPVAIGDIVTDKTVLGPEVARPLPADQITPADILGIQVDGAGDNVVGGSTPIEASGSAGGRVRGILEPLLEQEAPKELVDAGLGDAAPLEWHQLTNGEDFAIPGGFEGEFSLWDAWRLKAQQIDPNLIPTDLRIKLYEKLFRSQRRELAEPTDVWNRIAFAHISPNLDLLSNELGLAAMRATSIDDIARIAEMPHEELVALLKAGGSSPYPAQLASLQANARRFVENPEWFRLRDGEDLIAYSERVMSVLDGAGMKVGNFSSMLGDPLVFNRGTIDSHMVDVLAREGLLPEEVKVRLTDKKGNLIAPSAQAIPVLKRGKPNPDVPEHLRDLPWARKDGKVIVYGGDYKVASEALDRHLQALYPGLPFHSGGGQWFLWDMERRIVEPHTTIWPGADRLPRMQPDRLFAARAVARDAGYFKRKGARQPYNPTEGVFWQKAGKLVKGSTEFSEDARVVIRGLESPDISTFVHEAGHVFRRDLEAEDLLTAERHYGVKDGMWERQHEERFAEDFERWVRTGGKGVPQAVQGIFAQLYEWMRQLYRAVLRKDVAPEMSKVFRRLFEEQILGADEALARTGTPGAIEVAAENVNRTVLVKYGPDGKAVATLTVTKGSNGRAVPDGIEAYTVPTARRQGHASDLFREAENMGLDVEQASAVSTLGDDARAFQRGRWQRQRAAETTVLDARRDRVRALRSDIRDINARADEIRTTRVDPSFLDENGNPTVDPESLELLREQTAYVHENFPHSYGIEKAPKVSYARYQPDDSHLAALLTERSNLAQVLFDYGPLGKITQFVDWLTRPVKASKMAHDGRQQVYNLLLPLGAKTEEVTNFLNALRDEQNKGYTVSRMQQPFFRGVTAILPNRMRVLAGEAFGSNEAFIKRFAQKYGGIDRIHVALDEAHNSLIRKIDQQVLRGQKTNRLERIFRSAYWAWQNAPVLRTASDITRMASKVYYPLFRFQMDLRWQALNVIEADTIAFFRDGVDGTRFSRRRDQVVRRGGRDVNLTQNAVDFHGERSGLGGARQLAGYEETGIFLTNSNLAPVLKRSFQKQSLENVDAVLNALPDHDPIIQLLVRKYGPERGTWASQLNETLYSFDRHGVRKTIDEAVRRVAKYEKWSQAEYDQMLPFINKLIERNQQTFDDLVQIHVGNIDRSRLERTLNSFWLYWPISYQIKATKWMVGVLTERAFGQNTNLGGAFTLDRAAQVVRDQIATNPEFAQQMEDNEDWWFVASMLLPIAPWDWGVSLNRHVRYVGGNVLGLWPEYAGLDQPGDYMKKALEMGPVYTVDLLARLTPQLFGEPEEASRPSLVTQAP